MRVRGSAEELERRRRHALELLDAGHSLREVARMIGCEASSVMRWRDARQEKGEAGLKAAAVPGRPRKLSESQSHRLIRELLRGPLKHGYETELWTTRRVGELIEKLFGVRYNCDHVGRLLHRWGWSHQKPARRAIERDEEAIEEWKRKRWPQIKKTPVGWVPT